MKAPSNTSGHVFKRIQKGAGQSKLVDMLTRHSGHDRGRVSNTAGHLIDNLHMTLSHTCLSCKTQWVQTPEDILAHHARETPLKDIRATCPTCGSTTTSAVPVAI